MLKKSVGAKVVRDNRTKSPTAWSNTSVLPFMSIIVLIVTHLPLEVQSVSCSGTSTWTLQVDPITSLITIATDDGSIFEDPSLVPSTNNTNTNNNNNTNTSSTTTTTTVQPLLLRPESHVSGFLCGVGDALLQPVANRLCYDTYGAGFEGVMASVDWTTINSSNSSSSNNVSVLSSRFPSLLGVSATKQQNTVARTLSCLGGIFSASDTTLTTPDTPTLQGSCLLCDVTAVATECPTLMELVCRATATIERTPYAPLRIVEPTQWANATIGLSPSSTYVPLWYLQPKVCDAGQVATTGLGYGVVGTEVTGFTSGLDEMSYGSLQFGLTCDSNLNTSCWIVPQVSATTLPVPEDGMVIAVNVTRSLIVRCDAAGDGTPPLAGAYGPRIDGCVYSFIPSDTSLTSIGSAVDLSVWIATELSTTFAPDITPIVEAFVSAWCPVDAAGAPTPSLQRHRTCTTTAVMTSLAVPLCRHAGFDDGYILPPLSRSQIASANGAMDTAGNLSSQLAQLRCPDTYFPTSLIDHNFQACDAAWVGSSTPSTRDGAACAVHVVRCLRVEPPNERVDWQVGTALFCAVFVGSMLLGTVLMYKEREALQNPETGRSRQRYRARSSSRMSDAVSSVGGSSGGLKRLPSSVQITESLKRSMSQPPRPRNGDDGDDSLQLSTSLLMLEEE